MNYKALGIALLPVGIFLVILGGIFLPMGVNDYQHAVGSPNCITEVFGKNTVETCSITYAQAEALIVEAAVSLSVGITAIVGGIVSLRHTMPSGTAS